MTAQLEIRRMQREDVQRIMEIERECFPTPWHESAYLTELANRSAYYVVACINSLIVGYAGMWIIMDESHITTLGVGRKYRGKKIGEKLLVELLDESIRRNIRRATLEVRQSNKAAQNLYLKYGFIQAAIRRGYYTDNNENALIMWIDNLTSPAFVSKYNEMKRLLPDQVEEKFWEGVV